MNNKTEIDKKIDKLVSELLTEQNLDDWYYIASRLEFVAENIKKARGLELTEDYVRSCFKSFMEKCNEDI